MAHRWRLVGRDRHKSVEREPQDGSPIRWIINWEWKVFNELANPSYRSGVAQTGATLRFSATHKTPKPGQSACGVHPSVSWSMA